MTAAHFYLALMVLAMLPLAAVHGLCWNIVRKFPDIMPDERQRGRYMWAELAMTGTCLAMIWYMSVILDYMVTFCATTPALGMIAHMPWIFGTHCVLLTKVRHLMRLVQQVQALP